MLTYHEASAQLATARSQYAGKPIGHNTRLHERPGHIAVCFHATDILALYPDGRRALNTGGWTTVTTLQRLRAFTNARITSERSVWYVDTRPADGDTEPPFPHAEYVPTGEVTRWTDHTGTERSYAITARAKLTREQRAQRKQWREWRDRNRTPFYDGIEIDADGYAVPGDRTGAAREWCKLQGLRVRDGQVTLYKATGADYRSRHGAVYTPRTTVTARDYRPTPDCGWGLHASAIPLQAARYYGINPTILRVRVALDTLIPLGHDKCKFESCRVLYVDRRAITELQSCSV